MEVIVKWLLLSLAVIAIAAVLISTVMARRRANRLIRPAEILEPGWQFTAKPTSSALERPGTVFRIDRQRRRYLVERLPVPVVAAREAGGKSEVVIDTTLSVLARFLQLPTTRMSGSARFRQKLQLQLTDPSLETTTDVDIDPALDDLLTRLRYRADNRYFIIRTTRLASGIVYRLSQEQVNVIGVRSDALPTATLSGRGGVEQRNTYDLRQKFAEPMHVMFLPEEIGPIKAGLGGGQPELGVFPVTEVLEFEDDETGLAEQA
jgi:hypothetical protein